MLSVFDGVEQESIPTSTAVWNLSEWDKAEWGSEGDGYAPMLERLNALNKGRKNNAQDILIALTALKRKLTLVTNDEHLAIVLRTFDGSAETFEEFVAEIDAAANAAKK